MPDNTAGTARILSDYTLIVNRYVFVGYFFDTNNCKQEHRGGEPVVLAQGLGCPEGVAIPGRKDGHSQSLNRQSQG